MRIRIFTDGACSENPGPGGWAVVFNTAAKCSTISGNEGMIQYFQKNPTVFLVAIVIPLFLLLFANIGILVWYVKRSTKPKETSLNELSEEEKEKLKQELMKDLLNKEKNNE